MATQLDILVVEDHDILREELVSFLERPGWEVRGVDCGEEMDVALRTRPADIVVLDLNLPFEDGTDIAQRLRQVMPHMGIVMLTARNLPKDRARGYATGADVYLTKPTNLDELSFAIENLARRIKPDSKESAIILDIRMGQMSDEQGRSVRLTVSETSILMLLAMAPERQLASDFLLSKLGHDGENDISREKLTVLMSRLRSKIDEALGMNIIRSVRGFGYCLTATVQLQGRNLVN